MPLFQKKVPSAAKCERTARGENETLDLAADFLTGNYTFLEERQHGFAKDLARKQRKFSMSPKQVHWILRLARDAEKAAIEQRVDLFPLYMDIVSMDEARAKLAAQVDYSERPKRTTRKSKKPAKTEAPEIPSVDTSTLDFGSMPDDLF